MLSFCAVPGHFFVTSLSSLLLCAQSNTVFLGVQVEFLRPKIAVKKSTSTYTQVTKNIVQVLIFYFHMFTIFVLSGSVAKLSSSAISGKTKIYLFLINKIKFERVCLYKACQNPVTTTNHVRKTFILVIQSKNPSFRYTFHAS